MTESDVRKAIEVNRQQTELAIRDIGLLDKDLGFLKIEMEGLKKTLEEKHLQNRKDIHALRNSIQDLMDEFYSFCKSITESLHHMQLVSARAKGWWLGAGAVLAFVLEFVRVAVEHLWR